VVLNKKELIDFFELNVPEDGYAELEGSITPNNDFSTRGGITKQVLIPDYTEEIEVKVTFNRKYEPDRGHIFSEREKDVPPAGLHYSDITTNFPSYPGEPPEPPNFEEEEKMTIPEYDQCACGERGPHSHDTETNKRLADMMAAEAKEKEEKSCGGLPRMVSDGGFDTTGSKCSMQTIKERKMVDIEQLKTDGAIKAVRERIHGLQFKITSCAVWNKVATDTRYVRLGSAINQVREMLDEMELLLDELNKIQPGNK